MYWILWYTDYKYSICYEINKYIYPDIKDLDVLDEDVVREESSNKVALFSKKKVAEDTANSMMTPYRYVEVIPQELKNVDKNYYIVVDK